MKPLILPALACVLTACASTRPAHSTAPAPGSTTMRLGNFSVSLTVKDLTVSRAFYEKLGFRVVGGDEKTWVVLKNEQCKIGLFQGMFDRNMLTFNPGWDSDRNVPADFDDVRDIQRTLRGEGLTLTAETDDAATGPAYIMLADPDGNPILIDQHVPKGGK